MRLFVCLSMAAITLFAERVATAGELRTFTGVVTEAPPGRVTFVVEASDGEVMEFDALPEIPGVRAVAKGVKATVFYDSETGFATRVVVSGRANPAADPPSSNKSTVKGGSKRPDAPAGASEGSSRAATLELNASTVETLAQKCSTAKDALLLYEAVRQSPNTAEKDKAKLESAIARWKSAAAEDLHRVGDRWVAKDEAAKLRREAQDLVAQALSILDSVDVKISLDRLDEAGRMDPDNVEALYWKGVVLALVKRDFASAARTFKECLKKAPDDAGVLNNLALCQIRTRDYADAVRNWRRATALSPTTAHISQNVGRFLQLANNPALKMFRGVDKRALEEAATIYARAKESSDVRADVGVGFVYVLPVTNRGASTAGANADVIIGGGSGFVVAPELIVTNRHVVDDGVGFLVRSPSGPDKPLEARVEAVSDEYDLAILRCPGLKSSSLPISTTMNRGREICVFGYPRSDVLGDTLKMTEGIVTSLPDKSTDGMFLHSAIANPGNSGGPICDRTGAVVGILTAGYSGIEVPICAGVPSASLISFLDRQKVAYAKAAAQKPLSYEEIDKAASPAVVQVLILGVPNLTRAAGKIAYVDSSCLFCDGGGVVECPEKKCRNGRIRIQEGRVVDRNPLTGHAVVQSVTSSKPCAECNGKGTVRCPLCSGSGEYKGR